jgi:hypothetical protein
MLSIVSEKYRTGLIEQIIIWKFIDRLRHLWRYWIIFRCLEDCYWMCWEEKYGYDESIGELNYIISILNSLLSYR